MSTNKAVVYFLIFIFIAALYATFPKKVRYYPPEVKVNFKRKHTEKVTKTERDPFRYKIKRKSISQKQWKLSSIIVKAIIWDDIIPYAAISINDGKTIFVNEGDKIDQIKILKIERDKIVIDEYGKRTINFK
jgi:type II secretory pathway component PulC